MGHGSTSSPVKAGEWLSSAQERRCDMNTVWFVNVIVSVYANTVMKSSCKVIRLYAVYCNDMSNTGTT